MSGTSLLSRSQRLGGEASRILSQGRLSGPMLWVIAVAAGLALSNLAGNAQAEIDGGVTVQVVQADPTERNRQAETALAILNNREDVAQLRRVPDDELAQLIEPWLGDVRLDHEAVPTPALIDVRLRGAVTAERLEAIRNALASSAPAARVDAQASWLAPVFQAISSLQYLAMGLVLLLAATSAAAVWLSARSALGSNRDTIEVVHHLGGTDGQIAGIFQRAIFWDAVSGGAAGLLLGLAAIMLLGQQFAGLGSGLVAGGGLGIIDWIIIAAVPVIGVILALLTARFSVLLALRRIL